MHCIRICGHLNKFSPKGKQQSDEFNLWLVCDFEML